MSRGLNTPYFPNPTTQYDQRYMMQLVQAFSLFARQVQTPGPWQATELTLTNETGNVEQGKLSWSIDEETVDLTMGYGITQQIGFETYMRCENDTGSTIPNGTVVGFAGVNGEIKVAPYIADGTVPELYFVGVTTSEILDGEVRPITIYGKVRGLNTTGAPVSETWAAGDILYASPNTAGAFTKVRPTAPDAVIVVAAVLSVDATEGVIMVRPTIPLGLDYGAFTDTTDQTLAAADTATPVTLNTTEISNGVTVVNDGSGNPTRITVANSGFYQIAVSNQYTSSNSSLKDVQTWLSKNGTAVVDSNSYVSLNGNGVNVVFSTVFTISLVAGDYVQIMWACNDTAVSINNIAATGYSPAAPSVIVSVTQIQL
jgi:hypothetical protein